MAYFQRTQPAPINTNDYQKFQQHVQKDFRGICAYCLLNELFAAGERNFELDHFKPKSKFPDLMCDFLNLYWACHVCNNTKRATWPSTDLADKGFGFVDLCQDDIDQHFVVLSDGRLVPLTKKALYTVQHLRLNSPHLMKIRWLLAEIPPDKLARLGIRVCIRATEHSPDDPEVKKWLEDLPSRILANCSVNRWDHFQAGDGDSPQSEDDLASV